MPVVLNRRFTTAPMMDWSDRHCRYFWRQITDHAVLYTEMVTTGALIHGSDPHRFLDFNTEEQPVALQLGGHEPADLAQCAMMAQTWGYNEVNLNVGCPSDRVQNGMIGAVLMGHADLVRDGVKAMLDTVDIPVTVKHRIGIDDLDSYEFLRDFVGTVSESGCQTFIVHARKAILSGLSPKQNREVPPLDYARVYQLKRDFPDLEILINGGLKTLDDCAAQLEHLDGVMVGREAWHNPMLLAQVDGRFYGSHTAPRSATEVAERMLPYLEAQLTSGQRLNHVIKPLFNLFHECTGARQYRRYLSEHAHVKGAGIEVFLAALDKVSPNLEAVESVCHES
ncbi:tRNA dihydrouridine(20/20a) synthase DusA [Salinispirillum sp. LH 10-3-1]|uniref:tRNA-dihydrouridine(20/20a) synthase n=1 Tax=Salinispirillum sp. LH 10-3-1 TaxID=2952525 RepID=A0AB38YJ99_9GAMM